MENLQEQNDQTPEPQKQLELQNNMDQTEVPEGIDWDTFDLDIPAKKPHPVEKEQDPLVMFDAYVPIIPPPKRGGNRKPTEKECYDNPGRILKFKHDKRGDDKFFVSLWGRDMAFYFSFIEFEAHRQKHEGRYTHHKFKEFEWALDFYRRRMDKYETKHTEQELRTEFYYFNNPKMANELRMTW